MKFIRVGAYSIEGAAQAPARTTRVPAKRSCRPRPSRLSVAVSRPRPAGKCEHHPEQRAERRASDVRRAVAVVREHPHARDHLAERLPGCGERDEVAAVLQQQEGHERAPSAAGPLRHRQAADLHREVDDDDIDHARAAPHRSARRPHAAMPAGSDSGVLDPRREPRGAGWLAGPAAGDGSRTSWRRSRPRAAQSARTTRAAARAVRRGAAAPRASHVAPTEADAAATPS